MKGDYAKTIDVENIDKSNRYQAEAVYLSNGIDFKPYSAYNIESRNPYSFQFKREEYAK